MANPVLALKIVTDSTQASEGIRNLASEVAASLSQIDENLRKTSNGSFPLLEQASARARAGVLSHQEGLASAFQSTGVSYTRLAAIFTIASAAILTSLAGARAELERFSDILEKAKASNVSTTFFQAFTQSADEARVKVESLENALLAVQPNITDRLDEPAAAREVLHDLSPALPSGTLDRFDKATDTAGRVRVLITAIRDLDQEYKSFSNETVRLGAIKIAELFGPEFADQIRRGTIEIDKFKSNLDRLYNEGNGQKNLVPAETLQRIKELDDRVGEVDRSIRDSLRPAFGDLAAALLSVRAAGVALYEILGSIVKVSSEIYAATKAIAYASRAARIPNPGEAPQGETVATYDALGNVTGSDTVYLPSSAAARDLSGPFYSKEPPALIEPPPADPRKGKKPRPESPDTSREDQITRYIETLEREVRVVEAEVETFGRSNAEKARANALARIGAEEVTPAQIKQIEALTDRQSQAKESTERLRQAQEDYNGAVRLAGGAVSGFLSDIVSGGKNAEQALSNLIKRLADAVLQAQLLGDGPLAGLLGTRGKDGAVGGLIGQLFSGLNTSAGGGFAGAASDSLGFASPAARFANGGIMGAGGPLPLRTYSTGGIATGPQLALFGEGSAREAFVPLPDGRSIPVTLSLPDIAGLSAGARGGNGAAPLVFVYNNAPQAQISTRPDPSGNLMVFVEDAMASAVAKPGGQVQNAFANAFGLNPAAGIAR